MTASTTYRTERLDLFAGILTTRVAKPPASSDYSVQHWREAGLQAESHFRAFAPSMQATIFGRPSVREWSNVKACVDQAFAKQKQLLALGRLAQSKRDYAMVNGNESLAHTFARLRSRAVNGI